MAQLLQHQDSSLYRKHFSGCRWSILQFFGLRQRLRSTKMLSDRKHGQGISSGGSRLRGSYLPLKDEGSGIVDDGKNIQVAKKQKASKKNSSKASLKTMILRKLYGNEGQKKKILPVAPKLLRTLSIHYLESNDYLLDGEATSSGDSSSVSITNMNLQHATFDTLDGCDADTSSSLLLKRGDSNGESEVKDRKSHRSISMDGVLHKVPYGQKVSEDVIREKLFRSASATYDGDDSKPYISNAAKRHANQGFQRSRSLTESLERYSHLLDSISSRETKRMLGSSKSTRDHSLDDPHIMTIQKATSTPEFRSKSLARHAQNVLIPEAALASRIPEETVVDGYVKIDEEESSSDVVDGGSEDLLLFEDCKNDKRCAVSGSTEADSCTIPLPSEVVDIPEEHATTCDDDQIHSSTKDDACTAPSPSEEVDIPEEHATSCDGDQVHSWTEADSCTAPLPLEEVDSQEEHATCRGDPAHSSEVLKSIEGTFYVPDPSQEIEAETNLSCGQETESPMPVLDVVFPDHSSSPVKHTMSDDVSASIADFDANTSTELLNTSSTHKNVHESGFDELNSLTFQVDRKNEVEFNYVKDIFEKSNFSNEMLFEEWYSQNISALQEEDCQHYEVGISAFDFTDMSVDQLLLFDLTNEALLEIYKKYSSRKSKLSWFSSSSRPKPVGQHVLKELWSNVSCHLNAQQQSSTEHEILAYDLAKSDHWVNFQRDADHLGQELADFVLNKLLIELTFQLAKF